MRSLLIVDAESEALDRALASGADALILTLDAGQGGAARGAARDRVRAFLRQVQEDEARPLLYVRLPGIEVEATDLDIAGVIEAEPDGFFLGACRSGLDVQHLGAKLAVHEATAGLDDGVTGIIAEAGASASSLFGMDSYRLAGPRLLGLAWDTEGLAADLGISVPAQAAAGPFALARTLTLLAARSAGIAAIDSISRDTDKARFRAECEAARQDGFNAKIAATVEQVAIINAVFDREH